MKLPHLLDQIYNGQHAVIKGTGAKTEVLHKSFYVSSSIAWIKENSPGPVRIIRRRTKGTEFVNVPFSLEKKEYVSYLNMDRYVSLSGSDKKLTNLLLAKLDGARIYVSSGKLALMATITEVIDDAEGRWNITIGKTHIGTFMKYDIQYIQTYGGEFNNIRIG